MSMLDGNRLSYRSVLINASTVYRSVVWHLRANDRTRAVVLRVCVSLVWAALVGVLAATATVALGMTAFEIALAGIINGVGAAVYVYFFA